MKLSTQPYKGARDFYPEDYRVQKYIFSKWREVCERFGYEEYMTPILEPTDVYLSKGNEEIVREQTYTFDDRGGRSVTIRPEMTPSITRMVAGRRQEAGYPYRVFSIANFWRYERSQRGRLREFWQLNADVFGLPGIEADHECLTMADQIMQSFGAKRSMYEIRINSRRFINYLLSEYLELDEVESTTVIRLIDRMAKIPKPEFAALLEASVRPILREKGVIPKLLDILNTKEISKLPKELAKSETLGSLVGLMAMLEADGVTNARFDITLMRGFDYYTDVVFECFDLHPDNNRAMFGGGRYDGLMSNFGAEPVATFGFAPGDVSAQLFLDSHELLPQLTTETELYVVLAGTEYEFVTKLLGQLRGEGVNVAVDSTPGRKIGQAMKMADKKGIRYVVIVGESELANTRYKLKDMVTGKEEDLSVERMIAKIKDIRK
jgi:histidyl-tRNA synthetase